MDIPVDQNEETLENSVTEVIGTLPLPIQNFLQSPERDQISIKLTNKYSLHLDQASRFEKAYLFMLMGILTPEQFVSDLQAAGIDQVTVKALANDVNEEVFKPLRQKERQGSPAVASTRPSSPVQPATVPNPTPLVSPVGERTSAPYAGARPQPLTPFNLPGADARPDDLFRASTRTVAPIQAPGPTPQLAQAPVTSPAPIPIPPAPLPPRPTIPTPAQMPVEKVFTPVQTAREEALGGTLRTMATDMLAVNEHREPEPVQYKGTVFTPPMLMEKIPELIPVSPKPLVPLPIPVFHNTSTPSSIRPVARPTVTLSPSSELIKEYSSDPYREPV
jgi:hypothetical protein